MADINFNGRVAVVTGAGAGLGRAYALLFAARGAKVVVNDLGGGRHGDGKSSSAADAVVKEIISKGGVAVADYNSVVEGEKIIQTAMDNFGRVDILVNNAGILRDKSFARISDQDWNLIHDVHLKGSFKTTQAAFPIFKRQNYGRIIMTASNSGVYGNFGQANYSAAKLGLVGLANTIVIEGRKNNITCNVIVPTAASRLTEDILPPDVIQELRPELIAPVVQSYFEFRASDAHEAMCLACNNNKKYSQTSHINNMRHQHETQSKVYMCHESCQESGAIIDTAVGWAAKIHMVRGQGTHFRKSITEDVTLEKVRDNWSKVVDMSKSTRLSSVEEATGDLMANLQALKDGTNTSDSEEFSFTSKDFMIYALGIGATVKNETDLKYLYENQEDFSPFPTFFILPGVTQCMSGNIVSEAMPPGKVADFSNILHGEEYMEILGAFPKGDSKVISRSYVVDVLDKGSGIAVIIGNELSDSNGNVFIKCQMTVFIVGAGGYGGPRTSQKAVQCEPIPKRNPDAVVEQQTALDQAALYRLTGDINPLHIDPNMATIAGYERPILHGLSSLGFSARHVLLQFGNNDPANFRRLKARFVKPVLPGQTLNTKMWLEGNRVHFQTMVKETGNVVIDSAYMDLNSVSNMNMVPSPSAGSDLMSDAVFTRIKEGIKSQPEKAKSVNGIFLYNITADGKQVKQWTLDMKKPEVYEGAPKDVKVDTTLTVSDADMVDLALGKLNPQVAFMKGKLKISGNIMLTQKLVPLLKAGSKL